MLRPQNSGEWGRDAESAWRCGRGRGGAGGTGDPEPLQSRVPFGASPSPVRDPSDLKPHPTADGAKSGASGAGHANPVAIRSRVVLEIAAELVALADQPLRQAKVLLREQGAASLDWPLRLFGSSTQEGIDAVAARESALAMINPSAALTLAYRGSPPFSAPQPVRVISVLPSQDELVFAVHSKTGLTRFEQIFEERRPLKISVRGQRDHYLHTMMEHVANAAGYSLRDIEDWGGEIRLEGSLPFPNSDKFRNLVAGDLDAIFDEGVYEWLDAALAAGLSILGISDSTAAELESMGYRRAVLSAARYPKLGRGVPTMDFSGWPIFVHAELPDRLVTQICQALEARRQLIPWEGEGPLPLDRMCRDTPATPLDVPLHPAAEQFWRQRGYI